MSLTLRELIYSDFEYGTKVFSLRLPFRSRSFGGRDFIYDFN